MDPPFSYSDPAMWLLVPLGNPGDAYTPTRHNLGRLMLQRWMAAHCPKPRASHHLKTGTIYALDERFQALVPGTYMNLSGQACAEAVTAGCQPERMVLLYDDKDLPLGLGRLRPSGSDGGHNGLKSVFDCLGRQDLYRLRLGIGPFQRPLGDFVLGEWTPEEWDRIAAMDAPFARFMALLGQTDAPEALASTVNAESFWVNAP
jgi:PTH1 family peptidyl-tRNA hydrolase